MVALGSCFSDLLPSSGFLVVFGVCVKSFSKATEAHSPQASNHFESRSYSYVGPRWAPPRWANNLGISPYILLPS
ncbi:unnamed protein product [Cylicostephanus goldi]|uniref:Uncharacterized protein n=1 Tax=Cylicostephanus goldi TaxID=71465 RepID=A0A3P7M411_CYLGO|nr:unnamed protein product [Cylicostephanus goldi]